MQINEAAITIQSAFRGYSVRKPLLSLSLREKGIACIRATLNETPTASCGISMVYVPLELPLVLKNLGCENAKKRFWANWHASHLCLRARYTRLIVPKCAYYNDFTLEEKLPVTTTTLWSQTALYLKNLPAYSEAAKEFTTFLIETKLDDILTESHPYQGTHNLSLARNDNIPLILDKGKGKVALIDLGCFTLRDVPATKEEIIKCAKTAIALFPFHLNEICEAANVYAADFIDQSRQVQAIFHQICLGKQVSRYPVSSREEMEHKLCNQLKGGEILYYNFYKNRANQLMVVVHQ